MHRHPIRLSPGLACVWLLAGAQALAAQADTLVPRDTGTLVEAGAPVVFGSDTLFTLYARLGPFTAPARARAVEARLQQHLRAVATGAESLSVAEIEGRSEIMAGDVVLLTVLDGDAAPAGRPRPQLAQDWVRQIQATVGTTYQRTSLRGILLGAAYAVISTLVLLALLRLLTAVFPRIYRQLEALRGKLPSLRIQKLELISANRITDALTVAARLVRVVITVAVFYFYVPLVLSFFPWTAPLSGRIIGYVATPLRATGTAILGYIPKIFFIAVIILVTRYVLKVILLLFRAIASGTVTFGGFHREWADPTYKIVRFLVIAFAAVVMFPYLPGSGSDAFKGISLFVGVLFSLGSSGAVGNIVAGVVLTYTQAFRIGDRVKIGEAVGDVLERTLLVTRLRTIKNVDITIPNGAVLAAQIINYTAKSEAGGLILHSTVTIGYDVPWRQVHQLLIAAARSTANILAEPAPFVLQTSLDDFYVSYQINAYTDKPGAMARTYSELHQNIQDQFNQHGVEIMSPHYRALRDGNQVTIPAENLAADYQAPAFRVESPSRAGRD